MRILFALVAMIALIGCGSNASVEFGMNDETLLDGTAGDLRMRGRDSRRQRIHYCLGRF
jgi:hypothetical protein